MMRAAAAWQMAANVGLSMALYDTGGADKFATQAASFASDAARALDVQLPKPPQKTGKRAEDSAAVMKFLLVDCAKAMGSKVSKGGEASLVEIGLKTGVLLIIYGAGDDSGKKLATAIEARAREAGLPDEMVSGLIKGIHNDAPYADVRAGVLELHKNVAGYLTAKAGSGEAKPPSRK